METILANIPSFMIVFIRISSFIVLVFFFNNQAFYMTIKIGLALLLTILLFPVMATSAWQVPITILGFIVFLFQEILVGALIGFVMLVLLFSLQIVGRMMGFQMAFSMARAVDPTLGVQTNILAIFMVLIGSVLFLSLRGDYFLLNALAESFAILPPGKILVSHGLLKELTSMIVHTFEIGFRLAAPAIILLLCIDLTLGLIGKTASKMQIFFVGLPLKISIGMFSVTVVLSLVLNVWGQEIARLPFKILHLFKLMRI